MATDTTHLLLIAAQPIVVGDIFSVTRGAVAADCALDDVGGVGASVGDYFMRGDGASDDLVELLRDAYVADTAALDGQVTAALTFDFRHGQQASVLAMTDAGANWAPAHDDIDDTIGSVITGWPTTTPTEAATQTAALSSEALWVPAPSAGSYTVAKPAEVAVTQFLDASVQTAQRSNELERVAVSFAQVRGKRALANLATDTAATWENFHARNRWGRKFELWRVELDSSMQFAFGGAQNSELLGTYVLDEASARAGVNPTETGARVPMFALNFTALKVD